MADLDSRDKRSSSISLPWMIIFPLSDGTVDDPDRQQSAGDYAGISAGAPVPVVATAVAPAKKKRKGASRAVIRHRERRLREDEELLELIMIFMGLGSWRQ